MIAQAQRVLESDIQRQEQLERILSMTRSMLELARAQDWEALSELEPQRRQLIMAFFTEAPSLQEAAQVASVIEQVLAIDRETMGLGQAGLKQLGADLRNVGIGRRAHQAYSEHTA